MEEGFYFCINRKGEDYGKLTEQEIIRRQKMEELKAMGIDPFGHAYERTHKSGQIRAEYEKFHKRRIS